MSVETIQGWGVVFFENINPSKFLPGKSVVFEEKCPLVGSDHEIEMSNLGNLEI